LLCAVPPAASPFVGEGFVFDGGAFGNGPPVVGIAATAPMHGARALKPRTVLFSTAGLPKEFFPGPPDPCAPPPAAPPALPPAPPPAADAMLTLAIKSALNRNTCLNILCSAETPEDDVSRRMRLLGVPFRCSGGVAPTLPALGKRGGHQRMNNRRA
jgi:hypothetical protein